MVTNFLFYLFFTFFNSLACSSTIDVIAIDGNNGRWSCDTFKNCPDDPLDRVYHLKENFSDLDFKGGVHQFSDELRKKNYTVNEYYFSSYWDSHLTSRKPGIPQPGFLEAYKLIESIPEDHYIILVAGSQGSLWSHLLSFVIKPKKIKILIDCDGLSFGWDNFKILLEKEVDRKDREEIKKILGKYYFYDYDEINFLVTNRVPWNVQYNLELMREPKKFNIENYIGLDKIPNRREFGVSEVGIIRYFDKTDKHGDFLFTNTEAVKFIIKELDKIF